MKLFDSSLCSLAYVFGLNALAVKDWSPSLNSLWSSAQKNNSIVWIAENWVEEQALSSILEMWILSIYRENLS